MALMHRRHLALRVCAFVAILYSFYGLAARFNFEQYLDTLKLDFQDFPPEYVKVLNESVAQGKQPTEFDYASTFTDTRIPRIIHFIWFKNLYPSRDEVTKIPSIGSHAPARCREYNPDYEIRMWNATSARDFFEAEYSWFLPTYDGYRYPIQRIDALKYFALYHFGGVYMDMDIACRRSLDPLLDFPAWFPEASPLGVNNDLMASAARHPLVKRMTERLTAYDKNWFFPYLTIFWSTGPSYTSEILREWYKLSGGRRYADIPFKKDASPDAFFVLPQIFYSEQYTFFGHSPGGTWHGADVAVILWFVGHPWAIVCVVLSFIGAGTITMRRRMRKAESRRKNALPV